MNKGKTTTVGKYLTTRLEQAGLKHIFGVPGDYVLSFFDDLEESKLDVICTCNELNAGYAADAYARINGIGAICITYGVGAFSALNAVVGSFAERVPVVVISGAPKVTERSHKHLLHHTIGDLNLQYNIFEKITVATVILTNPEQAPQQIDNAISACLHWRRPVYIELPVDMVQATCNKPGPWQPDIRISSNKDSLSEAIHETIEILKKANTKVVIAGIEAHRLGIRNKLTEFINHSGLPFATNILSKTVIPERHPQFIGVYAGTLCRESARKLIENSDVILCLGTLMTDINLGSGTAHLDSSKLIVANSDKLRIRHHVYNNISLEDYLDGLITYYAPDKSSLLPIKHPSEDLLTDFSPQEKKKITLKRFYQRINRFIESDHFIIADAGDSIFSAANMFLPNGVEFIGQAFYLSIGYSVPATLALQLACKNKRIITFVGDGAFQMTAQEVGTMIRQGLNPIIFLINNDGYTIERVIHDGNYNDLHMWQYHKLPEIFNGGWGAKIVTEGDLENALQKVKQNHNQLALLEICVDKYDCSESLKQLGKAFKDKIH